VKVVERPGQALRRLEERLSAAGTAGALALESYRRHLTRLEELTALSKRRLEAFREQAAAHHASSQPDAKLEPQIVALQKELVTRQDVLESLRNVRGPVARLFLQQAVGELNAKSQKARQNETDTSAEDNQKVLRVLETAMQETSRKSKDAGARDERLASDGAERHWVRMQFHLQRGEKDAALVSAEHLLKDFPESSHEAAAALFESQPTTSGDSGERAASASKSASEESDAALQLRFQLDEIARTQGVVDRIVARRKTLADSAPEAAQLDREISLRKEELERIAKRLAATEATAALKASSDLEAAARARKFELALQTVPRIAELQDDRSRWPMSLAQAAGLHNGHFVEQRMRAIVAKRVQLEGFRKALAANDSFSEETQNFRRRRIDELEAEIAKDESELEHRTAIMLTEAAIEKAVEALREELRRNLAVGRNGIAVIPQRAEGADPADGDRQMQIMLHRAVVDVRDQVQQLRQDVARVRELLEMKR
jgi:hypothetical protein